LKTLISLLYVEYVPLNHYTEITGKMSNANMDRRSKQILFSGRQFKHIPFLVLRQ